MGFSSLLCSRGAFSLLVLDYLLVLECVWVITWICWSGLGVWVGGEVLEFTSGASILVSHKDLWYLLMIAFSLGLFLIFIAVFWFGFYFVFPCVVFFSLSVAFFS